MEQLYEQNAASTPVYQLLILFSALKEKNGDDRSSLYQSYLDKTFAFFPDDLLSFKQLMIGILYIRQSTMTDTASQLDGIIQTIHQATSHSQVKRVILDGLSAENEPRQAAVPGESYAHQAYQYIATHFQSNVQLKAIAQELYVSSSYLSRIIKDYYGRSFVELLTDVRLNHAKSMLSHSNESIKLIAEYCGFSDYIYFYKVFKKFVGMSPVQYRTLYAQGVLTHASPGAALYAKA